MLAIMKFFMPKAGSNGAVESPFVDLVCAILTKLFGNDSYRIKANDW